MAIFFNEKYTYQLQDPGGIDDAAVQEGWIA